MAAPTVFDRLRALETQGRPLHALIVETCDVGDELVRALSAIERIAGGMTSDNGLAIYDVARHARARAYDSGNGHTPDNGKAAA